MPENENDLTSEEIEAELEAELEAEEIAEVAEANKLQIVANEANDAARNAKEKAVIALGVLDESKPYNMIHHNGFLHYWQNGVIFDSVSKKKIG